MKKILNNQNREEELRCTGHVITDAYPPCLYMIFRIPNKLSFTGTYCKPEDTEN
jgi:hypothetical protein